MTKAQALLMLLSLPLSSSVSAQEFADDALDGTLDSAAIEANIETALINRVDEARISVGTEPSQPPAASIHSPSWGAEGRIIAYTRQRAIDMDIMTIDVSGDGEPQLLIDSAYLPQFAPNGRWLAYIRGTAQQAQVYVREYPDGNDIVVSRGFGTAPRWSADGTELFFQGLDGSELAMLSVPISGEEEPVLGQPTVLFPLRILNDEGEMETFALGNNLGSVYDVLPDGRFLMPHGPDAMRQRKLVLLRGY